MENRLEDESAFSKFLCSLRSRDPSRPRFPSELSQNPKTSDSQCVKTRPIRHLWKLIYISVFECRNQLKAVWLSPKTGIRTYFTNIVWFHHLVLILVRKTNKKIEKKKKKNFNLKIRTNFDWWSCKTRGRRVKILDPRGKKSLKKIWRKNSFKGLFEIIN